MERTCETLVDIAKDYGSGCATNQEITLRIMALEPNVEAPVMIRLEVAGEEHRDVQKDDDEIFYLGFTRKNHDAVRSLMKEGGISFELWANFIEIEKEVFNSILTRDKVQRDVVYYRTKRDFSTKSEKKRRIQWIFRRA